MSWKGTILEESLNNKSSLEIVEVVDSQEMELEGSEEAVTLHKFELEDSRKEEFIERVEDSLKEDWYVHLVKDGTTIVIYRSKHFKFREDEKGNLREARDYGISEGIPEEQLGFEKLFENPYA